jgi:antitoxin component YwqK of YwqJK toxin-antitoxin module
MFGYLERHLLIFIGGIKIFNRKNMKKLELTKDELEKLYYLPPKDVEKETEFQITYRMGRNSLVLELVKKIDEELTPYIEYYDNGNVLVKGQENSKGQEEGIWEIFWENGNIHRRIPYVEGKEDGIEEWFYPNGNISCRTPFKDGNMDGIQEEFNEQGNIVKTTLWKEGELIETTEPELTPYIMYHNNGNVWVKGQKNSGGQEEGICEWFYKNGNTKWRTPYKGGKQDGIVELFYENGNTKWRIPYKNGMEDGVQECFDEQGNITKTLLWKDGELIETTEPELTPYIMYHNNGNVWIKGQRNSKGQEEGIWEEFYPNGNIKCRIPYKEDKRDGIMEWFDEQGNITLTRLWKDGKLIEETKPKPQPDPQLIDSMAMRYTHDFGFLDEKHKESIRTTMKQLWEEVVGLGFYKPKSK